jgi:hypothetical protein
VTSTSPMPSDFRRRIVRHAPTRAMQGISQAGWTYLITASPGRYSEA